MKSFSIFLVVLCGSWIGQVWSRLTRTELDAAYALWQEQGSLYYEMTFGWNRFFTECYVAAKTVQVTYDSVTSVEVVSDDLVCEGNDEPSLSQYRTIEELLVWLYDFVDDSSIFSIEATFDETYGYTTSVSIDFEEWVADEELGWYISSYQEASSVEQGCGWGGSGIELVADQVYGCYGTFSSGTISDSALNLCNRGYGYHECESANEASVLGLTQSICDTEVPTDHFFWSLESSNGNSQCHSEYGSVADGRPSDDVWGCVGSSTIVNGLSYSPCGPYRVAANAGSTDYAAFGFDICDGAAACDGIEQFVMEATDAETNGVLCCADDALYDNLINEFCDESITVTAMYLSPRFENNHLQYSPYVGKYQYYGNDDNGYPRYVNPSSQAEIGVTSYLTDDLLVGLQLPGVQSYWAGISENGAVTDIGNNQFEIINALFDGTDQTFYTRGDAITVRMVFNDCEYYGFERMKTPAPTTESDVPTCPDYDYTVFDSCGDDGFCGNCQSWGCPTCADGYYKMGNKMRCQSCSENYPNCALCGDWNGCTACDEGYTLQWEPDCNDQICVANA